MFLPIIDVKVTIVDYFQELLNLKFSKIEGADVWHKDVTMVIYVSTFQL